MALVISIMCVTFDVQEGITPFRLAVQQERSKIVKYFAEEIKVDTTLYDQVIIIMLQWNICSTCVAYKLLLNWIKWQLKFFGS